jgi:site-specific DNA-methyltransferase (adenine-specific)
MNGIVREVTIGDCRLIQGDCLEVMPGLGSVDCVLTDPPYGTTACKWDSVIPFAPMWAHLKRIVKPSGAIVLTASQPFTSALVMSNVKMFKYCWVWEKSKATGHALCKKRPMKAHEDIVVFCDSSEIYIPQMNKGSKYSAKLGKKESKEFSTGQTRNDNSGTRYPRSVQYFKTSESERNDCPHPTQKPVALMEYLIRTYTNPGETVLDFTMGSGTTGVAAANTGRRFVGIERDLGYFDVAVKRTREAVEQASAPVQGGMGF